MVQFHCQERGDFFKQTNFGIVLVEKLEAFIKLTKFV